MKVTHVLRGEDLLSSTPRQVRVYQAMGLKEEDFPVFAHLPFVMGQDNTKLSKRNGEVSVNWYREAGFLPEAICNYLALLGWSPGEDRENITMQELTELFTVERVHSSPAKFDMKKLEAINGDKIRELTLDEFLDWSLPFLKNANVISGSEDEIARVKAALPIIQERITKLSEIPGMLKFLFMKDFAVEPESIAKVNDAASKGVLLRSVDELAPLSEWTHSTIEAVLRSSLIEEMGLKPRVAFGSIRIAVTGSTISPPLFESMELLGKSACLERISSALAL
jgi:glutamyl-tRNA synthetase